MTRDVLAVINDALVRSTSRAANESCRGGIGLHENALPRDNG